MHLSKNYKISLLFLGMLFCHIVVPNFLPFVSDMSLYSLLVLSQVLVQLPVVVYLAAESENPLKLISLKPVNPISLLLLVLMTFCVIPFAALLNLISQLFSGNALAGIAEVTMGGSICINLLFIALMPALSEEFAFRGVIFHSLRRSGGWFAIVLSALFFGMMHLNLNQFFYTFGIGIFMALAVEATGSLWGSVAVHFTLNANSVVLMKVLDAVYKNVGIDDLVNETGKQTISSSQMILSIIVIGGFALVMMIPAISLLFAAAKLCKREESIKALFVRSRETAESDIKAPEKRRKILDIFFVLCVAASFAYMILVPV